MPEAFPPLDPEYDRFLYAVVGSEANGMELTVASAIARSGADPWREAALIAKMPKDVAFRVLACFIPDRADGRASPADDQQTVERLFALLPARGRMAAPASSGGRSTELILVIVAVALCAGFVLAPLFAPKTTDGAPPMDAPAAASSERAR